MSVKIDPATGRRSIAVEVEVPGTVEEVWAAIATPGGISGWFAPTEKIIRDGKPVILTHIAPGMTVEARETLWDPPHRFVGEADLGPNGPPLAAEWSVEAIDGGHCTVRIVHSLFASTDDWDNQLTGAESGWPGYFRVLKLYLEHFKGQPAASIIVMSVAEAPLAEVWAHASAALPLQGVQEHTGATDMIRRVADPAPGLAALHARPMGGGRSLLALNFYLYGESAKAIAERDQAQWQTWFRGFATLAGSAKAT